MRRIYAKGTWIETWGPWDLHYKARAICPDGELRIVRLSTTPDTYFSVPGRTQAHGKTVAGYITMDEDEAGSPYVEFRPYLYRKNHSAVEPATAEHMEV